MDGSVVGRHLAEKHSLVWLSNNTVYYEGQALVKGSKYLGAF